MLPMGSIFFPFQVATLTCKGKHMLHIGSIFFPLIVASFKTWFPRQHTKDVFSFIACCITEFETVYRGLIIWRFLFIPPKGTNKNTPSKDKCFTEATNALSLWLIYTDNSGLVTSNVVRVNIQCLQIFGKILVTGR